MSYARWSEDSDVYVFLSVDRQFECCACSLGEIHADTAAIVAHLEAHIAAGHQVPADTIDRLRADAAVNDAWLCRWSQGAVSPASPALGVSRLEIGRASCRERVSSPV